MNLPLPAPSQPAFAPPAQGHNWLRRLVNATVAIVVLAVAATMFFLSYPGVHAIALQGGMTTRLARVYPGLFDAVLLVACVAAVMLRGARWWARGWAWLVIIVILGAVGATDAAHAMNYALPHRQTEGVVAAAPAVAVLLAFSLLLTLLRESRPQAPGTVPAGRAARRAAARQAAAAEAAEAAEAGSFAAGAVARQPAPPIALPPAMPRTQPAAAQAPAAEAAASEAGSAREAGAAAQEMPAAAETGESPAGENVPEPAGNAAEPGPGLAPTREEPVLAPAAQPLPDVSHPAAQPDEVLGQATPATEVAPEPPTAPLPPAAPAIKYANSAAMPEYRKRSEPDPGYWNTADAMLAGQVYPVEAPESPAADNAAGDAGRREPREIDQDAPPFATAPFASVPRLNRVRSTPLPPGDDEA